MSNTTTPSLVTARGIIALEAATIDELYSARSHGWSEVYSSLSARNEFGQRLRGGRRLSRLEEATNKQALIESRGLPEIEAELVNRGADTKAKGWNRVAARWNHA